MRNDLAQYYNSNKPSIRLQYQTTLDEKVNFELFGTDLLLRDFNIYCSTRVNHRELMQQLRSLALNNNTTGASIYDLGSIIKADSIAELEQTMKSIEQKTEDRRRQEMEHEQQLEQQRMQSMQQNQQAEQAFISDQKERDRRKDVLVAEIRTSGYAAAVDVNDNNRSDFFDSMDQIRKQREYEDLMNFKREQEINKRQGSVEKLDMKRQELQSRERIADKQLQIARVNKNRYDKTPGKEEKKKSS
jgi:hypothetical protein